MSKTEHIEKELNKLRSKILNNEELMERVSYFYFRWQDEMQYEDFNDYKTAVKNCFKKELNIEVKLLKPFTVRVNKNIKNHKCILEFKFGKRKITSTWKILN